MKREIFLRILFGIIAFVLLVGLLTKVFVEPWIGEKISPRQMQTPAIT